ncbi:MAG: hypothetical protein LRZ85_05470 [Alphaproteobacteria bacterium]|nr:hypothetical protein [Alphaproteobacteria bacterium]MCD8520047.1 hypothetical protein [Alphaproteobacteria bacterium]MCD8569959.1 hypothetical protein [Alphaproteobacteria bacterium]
MKKSFAILSFLVLAGCCSDALAADEFGSRFGNASPYALGNTMGKASDSASGMGMDDLNTITPAAGDELDPEATSDMEEIDHIDMGPQESEMVDPAQSAPEDQEQ